MISAATKFTFRLTYEELTYEKLDAGVGAYSFIPSSDH